MMHTLGFYHEHSRSDRDMYIKVSSTYYDNTLDKTGTCKQGLFYHEHNRSGRDMYIKVSSTYYEYVI